MENKMFSTKQRGLITTQKVVKSQTSVKSTENPFVTFGMKKGQETKSTNGALKYKTSGYSAGSLFVNQFATVATYKNPRSFEDISRDMATLYAVDQEMAVKFILYLRMITRQVSLFDGTKTKSAQRGAGLKHEAITRMVWLAVNAPETFAKNLELFISVGSWQDVIKMLSYDLQYNDWKGRVLDWQFMGNVILAGLENPNTTNLVRKYLPTIKSNKPDGNGLSKLTLEAQADNVISKWICSLLFGTKKDEKGKTYKQYRQLKKNGNAHQWQQLISQGKHNLVDFSTVHGRALSSMVSGKYLKNHGLENKYQEWIATKPVAKFTGYPYELAQLIPTSTKQFQKDTINAQFNQLVEVSKKGLVNAGIRPMTVIDISGSMSYPMYIGGGKTGTLKSKEVAFSSAIFFNEMQDKTSPFYNTYMKFSYGASMATFTGNNFISKYTTSCYGSGGGNTDFQSIFNTFVDFKRQNPDVSEELVPNFLVVFSDGQFDGISTSLKTNVELGREKLASVFSKEFCDNFGICFVDLPNTCSGFRLPPKPTFETFGNCKNTFYFSGYDMSPLGFLFGVEAKVNKETGEIVIPKTAEELFEAAMDQEILNLVTI